MIEFKEIASSEKDNYVRWIDHNQAASLFHSLPWMDFICREHHGVPRIYQVWRQRELLGYWPFIQVRKGPFRIWGSPLRGWLTSKMGPLLTEPAGPELITALQGLCKQEGVHYLETSGDALNEAIMPSPEFAVMERGTYILEVTSDLEEQWYKMKRNTRNRIRKAQRNIEIRQLHNNDFAAPLYGFVTETFKSKKLAVPYQYRRLELLHDTIGKVDRLLFLGAFLDANFVGGYIWGFDNNTAHAFVAASRTDLRDYQITSLLLWEGVKRFSEMGLKYYDMYGGEQTGSGVSMFKASFGSSYQSTPHFVISFSKLFSGLLHIYENYYLNWKKYPTHLRLEQD